MNCDEIEILLSAYVDGELTPDESQIVGAHLQNCLACQQTLAEFTTLTTLFNDLAPVEAPAGFRQRVTERLDSKPRTGFLWRMPRLAYALSFTFLLLIGGTLAVRHSAFWQSQQPSVWQEQAALEVEVFAEDFLFGSSPFEENRDDFFTGRGETVGEEILHLFDIEEFEASDRNGA